MWTQSIKLLGLSLSLILMSQFGHSAAINTQDSQVISPLIKISPIEKALQQQRAENKSFKKQIAIKDLTVLNVPPSQSFLAAQNERFSRFIQSIFTSNHS